MTPNAIDRKYLTQVLEKLLNIHSPTGYTKDAITFLQGEFQSLGIITQVTPKGSLKATLSGSHHDSPRAITAHTDTLGAMVSQILPGGRLRMTALNGVEWGCVESEGVTILTRSGVRVRGSIVLTNSAVHVNKEIRNTVRTAENLEIRIDEVTKSEAETRALGINVGDFVFFDPRYEASQSGFIRSRFLDDKACVACILSALKTLKDCGSALSQATTILISIFEEVGHGGMDSLPDDLAEYLVLDMACIGEGVQGDERKCSICIKDSSGPYSDAFTRRLRDLATANQIDLLASIYPYYGSDGSAYWRSGGNAQVALIGPGVDSSHCYERTHIDALLDTTSLLCHYLVS